MDINKLSEVEKKKLFSELYRNFNPSSSSESDDEIITTVLSVSPRKIAQKESTGGNVVESKKLPVNMIGKGRQGVRNPEMPGKKRGVRVGSTREVKNTKLNQCIENGIGSKIYKENIQGKSQQQLAEEYQISKYMVNKLITKERARVMVSV
jgi:hypothetical protein